MTITITIFITITILYCTGDYEGNGHDPRSMEGEEERAGKREGDRGR